ncbi:MBL fold metallo-hydrolase [Candidatus Stoquefichus massiliensis]|uniref:MBL fold metallo-hydrolase n=1 Tax=Candidatus Stoquefichus massiliensis TaxID=1470350 RepID=UPI0004BCD0DE|nr:MBL fold metallo-hydrolase [Candidatus Stoquefichus massiliensis]
MKICEGIHQLKIDFYVTSEIKRFVYVYIITGHYCYLIDTGVAGSEKVIENYLESIGYHLDDIKAIFLTHAHPDHMGSAGMIQKKTGCQIYASYKEKEWMEDIDQQFQERPIPNFYQLLQLSVHVNYTIEEDMLIQLEDSLSVDIIQTPGHSEGCISFLFNKRILMCGDAIPVVGDIPIYTDALESLFSLEKLYQLPSVDYYCPAWDNYYSSQMGKIKIQEAKKLIQNIGECVREFISQERSLDDHELFDKVCNQMKMHSFKENPLFLKTILSYRNDNYWVKSYHSRML